MKKYKEVIRVFMIILFFPLFLLIILPFCLLGFILFCFITPYSAISNRKNYKKSAYYQKYKRPYNNKILSSNNYIFYNYAAKEKLDIQYVREKSNGFEYFIYEDSIFIFPDFNEIEFNVDKGEYEIVYNEKNKETYISIDEFINNKRQLFDHNLNLPIKILVLRNYFSIEYLDIDNLPQSLYVIKDFNTAFKNDNKKTLSIVPNSTKTLYKMMLENEKLGGKFELKNDDEQIIWTFENVRYEIEVDESEGYLGVFKNNKSHTDITHWHPLNYEIYDEVCNIGEKGNVLIIKSFLGSTEILYMGNPKNYVFDKNKKHFGKIYYFESK